LPGLGGNASVAASATLITRNKVLGRKNDIGRSVSGDAHAVRERFGGTECPAATTLFLVADGMDAVGPLSARIKGGRSSDTSADGNGDVGGNGDVASHHGLGFVNGHVGKEIIVSSLPRKSGAIDSFDNFLVKSGAASINASNDSDEN